MSAVSAISVSTSGELPHSKPARRTSQTDSVVLPAVDTKQRTPLTMVRPRDLVGDGGPSYPSGAVLAQSGHHPQAPPQPTLPMNYSENLFTLESEDDEDESNNVEVFPFLTRPSLTEVPGSNSASSSLPFLPHQPPVTTKDVSRTLLNAKFHARRLHTPVWDSLNGDRDCPIGRGTSAHLTVLHPPVSLSSSHLTDSVDETLLRNTSDQASADFADYMQQHLSEMKHRRRVPVYFGHSRHAPAHPRATKRAATAIQWSAFEFREDEPPTHDNPFTRWSTVTPLGPCSPALSARTSCASRHNVCSDTDGLSESSQLPSDNPLTEADCRDAAPWVPPPAPVVPPPSAEQTGRRSYPVLTTSVVVPVFPVTYGGEAPPAVSVETLSRNFLIPAKQREVTADRSREASSRDLPAGRRREPCAVTAPHNGHRLSAHAVSASPSPATHSPRAEASASTGATSPLNVADAILCEDSLTGVPPARYYESLSATEAHYSHPVCPNGCLSATRYSRTFTQSVTHEPPPRISETPKSYRPFSITSRENKLIASAPTVPLTCPSIVSRRPILSIKLPHKSQLARRALEDNELFFQRRLKSATERGDATLDHSAATV